MKFKDPLFLLFLVGSLGGIIFVSASNTLPIELPQKQVVQPERTKIIEAVQRFPSKLPKVIVSCRDQLQKRFKVRCNVQAIVDAQPTPKYKAYIKIKGSQAVPKPSYAITLKKKKGLLGMRKSDLWELNAEYHDPTLIRRTLSQQIYQLITQKSQVPQSKFVEFFMDDNYQGVYQLSEKISRKLLGLKAFKSAHQGSGMIFKIYNKPVLDNQSNIYRYGNLSFKQQFPDLYKHSFSTQRQLLTFFEAVAAVENTTATKNKKEGLLELDPANAIDFFLHSLVVGNRLKSNYIMYRTQQKDSPFLFMPLDNTDIFGVRNKYLFAPFNKIYLRFPWDKIVAGPEMQVAIKKRWFKLRQKELANETILQLTRKNRKMLDQGIYTNRQRFPQKKTSDENDIRKLGVNHQFSYLDNWIVQRLEFLDSHFMGKDKQQ